MHYRAFRRYGKKFLTLLNAAGYSDEMDFWRTRSEERRVGKECRL